MLIKLIRYTAFAVVLLLCGCASFQKEPPEKRGFILSSVEEKILGLEEKIQSQELQIEKLRSALNRSAERAKVSSAPSPVLNKSKRATVRAPVKVSKIKKLYPPMEQKVKSPPSARDLFMEGETLADSSQSAMHSYFKGLQLMSDKKYDEALQSFRSFVMQNPKHVYADRAQYLIADAHFQTKDYNLVVVATNLLEARYPYSIKLPEALYKRGLSFLELSQTEQARITLRNLIQKFPNDPLTAPVQRKLAGLSSSAPR